MSEKDQIVAGTDSDDFILDVDSKNISREWGFIELFLINFSDYKAQYDLGKFPLRYTLEENEKLNPSVEFVNIAKRCKNWERLVSNKAVQEQLRLQQSSTMSYLCLKSQLIAKSGRLQLRHQRKERRGPPRAARTGSCKFSWFWSEGENFQWPLLCAIQPRYEQKLFCL